MSHEANLFAAGHYALTSPAYPNNGRFARWQQAHNPALVYDKTADRAHLRATNLYYPKSPPSALDAWWYAMTGPVNTALSTWINTAEDWQIKSATDRQLAAAQTAFQRALARAHADAQATLDATPGS